MQSLVRPITGMIKSEAGAALSKTIRQGLVIVV